METFQFDPSVWGPHYWFFLHTISHAYPLHPNQVTKRKYYDLIMNMPLFIPNHNMASYFSEILTLYPVTPYLDSRESFIRWMIFIHNKINIKLGYKEIQHEHAIDLYCNEYLPKPKYLSNKLKKNKRYIVTGIIIVLGISIVIANGYYTVK